MCWNNAARDWLIAHLDVSVWVDLVHSAAGSSTRLAVQVVAVDKHAVVAVTPDPNVALASPIQHHAFANVQSEAMYLQCTPAKQ